MANAPPRPEAGQTHSRLKRHQPPAPAQGFFEKQAAERIANFTLQRLPVFFDQRHRRIHQPGIDPGLHFLIPIGVLIWCLMIEELSPALAAFWATSVLIVLMLSHRPLTVLFRRQQGAATEVKRGFREA